MEGGARDERPQLDAARHFGEPRERRPAVPRSALGPAVAAVEQMVADPDRVEPDVLGCARHRRELVAAHDALDFGKLHTDLHRASAQNASNAGGSDGIATIRCHTPSRWSISST